MSNNRRAFLATAVAGAASSVASRSVSGDERPATTLPQLQQAAARPVLQVPELRSPVKVASVELLRNGRTFLVRARSTDGAEGLAAANDDRLIDLYPILLRRVIPFFIGKDARDLDRLVDVVYVHDSNYKLQGLALWVCVASVEFALLDLLGKLTGKSIGNLLGGGVRKDIAVYRASGNRGNTPEEEIAYLQKLVAETGAKAIKFRLGGRMSKNNDSLPGRTETLIPLVRKTFGDAMTLYADSNGSYDVPNSIRIGRMMESHGYAFLEEPCEFDQLWETKQVADALDIPIALGEQEFSVRRFQWIIENGAAQVIQPDLHYYGGFIRSIRVARMAAAAGLPCTPHMSGAGLGYLDVLHFASCVPNVGPHQEFKGESTIPVSSDTSSLRCRDGIVRVPSGPGFGITIDPDFIRQTERVTI
jgi:L-alanine-DL-glutamate epimerase-like enolase superfamily enzyme